MRRYVDILWAMLNEDLREKGVDRGACTRGETRAARSH